MEDQNITNVSEEEVKDTNPVMDEDVAKDKAAVEAVIEKYQQEAKEKMLEQAEQEAKEEMAKKIEEEKEDNNNLDFGDEDATTPEIVEAEPEIISLEEKLSRMSEAAKDNITNEDYEVTIDDIKESVQNSSMTLEDDDFQLTDESALVIVDLINRVKNKERNINIYAEFPQQLKDFINESLKKNGRVDHSIQTNTIRNTIAKSMLDEFMGYIEINHSVNSFNTEMESMFSSVGSELSTLYKEYDNERTTYLKSLLEKIPEGDPKRQVLTDTLDAIHESYSLKRLKDAVGGMKKIKSIELDKPEQRIFGPFKNLYKDSKYNMYDPNNAVMILNKYNKTEDEKANLKFMITFCKFCLNNKYQPDNTAQHAFMYYSIYNIFLLEIYKDKEYDEYAPGFLANINEIISQIKSD